MSVYESLLKQIFFSRFDSGLILLPEPYEDAEGEERKGTFDFAIDFNQFGWDIRRLSAGDDFVASMIGVLKKESPQAIFIFPVWSARQRVNPRLRKMYGNYSLEMITLLQAINTVKDDCHIATIVPVGSVGSYTETDARKTLSNQTSIEYVIESTADTLLHNVVAVNTATIILRKQVTEQQNISFFQLAKGVEDDKTTFFRGLAQLKQGQIAEMPYGYHFSGQLDEQFSLSYTTYHPHYDRLKQEFLSHFSETIGLDSIYDVIPSVRSLPQSRQRPTDPVLVDLSEQESEDIIPVISARDIDNIRGIIRDGIPRGAQNLNKRYLLKANDICLAQIMRMPMTRIAVVTEEDLPLAAFANVIVLRPKENTSKEQQELLFNYLQSKYAAQFLERSSSMLGSHVRLSPQSLRDLIVPKPSEALLEAFHELRDAEFAYTNWINEVRQARSNLFGIPDNRDTRLQIKTETRRVRQRYQVAASMDDFATRVRTRFPHPIAYRWKIIETSYPNYEGYKRILECAEVAVAYLASIAIMMANEHGFELGEVVSEAKSLGAGKSHGKTFGYWKRVLEHAQNSLKDVESSLPFYDIIRFAETSLDDDSIFDFLYKARNDDAHGEGPKGHQVEGAYRDARGNLQSLLEAVEFLSEYRLIYIEKTRRDTQTNVTYYDYRELMGDHHLVPIVKEACIEDCEIEANSLYLIDRDDQLHLMRPILLWHPTAESDRSATFYLNKYDDENDLCEIRSLELGDTIPDIDDMTEQFESAGLLIPKESNK